MPGGRGCGTNPIGEGIVQDCANSGGRETGARKTKMGRCAGQGIAGWMLLSLLGEKSWMRGTEVGWGWRKYASPDRLVAAAFHVGSECTHAAEVITECVAVLAVQSANLDDPLHGGDGGIHFPGVEDAA